MPVSLSASLCLICIRTRVVKETGIINSILPLEAAPKMRASENGGKRGCAASSARSRRLRSFAGRTASAARAAASPGEGPQLLTEPRSSQAASRELPSLHGSEETIETPGKGNLSAGKRPIAGSPQPPRRGGLQLLTEPRSSQAASRELPSLHGSEETIEAPGKGNLSAGKRPMAGSPQPPGAEGCSLRSRNPPLAAVCDPERYALVILNGESCIAKPRASLRTKNFLLLTFYLTNKCLRSPSIPTARPSGTPGRAATGS